MVIPWKDIMCSEANISEALLAMTNWQYALQIETMEGHLVDDRRHGGADEEDDGGQRDRFIPSVLQPYLVDGGDGDAVCEDAAGGGGGGGGVGEGIRGAGGGGGSIQSKRD